MACAMGYFLSPLRGWSTGFGLPAGHAHQLPELVAVPADLPGGHCAARRDHAQRRRDHPVRQQVDLVPSPLALAQTLDAQGRAVERSVQAVVAEFVNLEPQVLAVVRAAAVDAV